MDYSIIEKVGAIERNREDISILRQCELLGLNRSAFYYERETEVSWEDKIVMDYIDKTYTDLPFYGVPKMTREVNDRLLRDMNLNIIEGFSLPINHKRIYRLMQILDIHALRPKPKLSIPNKDHFIYPYLLKDVEITHPNHVWSLDITYIKLRGDWMYLVAIIDWYSRFVLSWELSDTMTVDFCMSALQKALQYGLPDIHNSDQGSQMTAEKYVAILKGYPSIKISMDHKGRCFDNIFIERFWRSLKYEEVYLKDYQSPREARISIGDYMTFYNYKRFHQSLAYQTPAKVYFN
ncbi:MAG: IS3 family transposase [Chitinophagaceae bacterium]